MGEEKRVAEELISVMRVLGELFPPGADEKIVIDSEVFTQIKSKRKLTLKHYIYNLYKLIEKLFTGAYMKKLLFILIVLLFFSGCEVDTDYQRPRTDAERADAGHRAHCDAQDAEIIFNGSDTAINVTQNITLPEYGPLGSTYTWISTNKSVISETGVVTRGASDVTVDVHVIAEYWWEKSSKCFILTVKAL
jgi:hypothetical protein